MSLVSTPSFARAFSIAACFSPDVRLDRLERRGARRARRHARSAPSAASTSAASSTAVRPWRARSVVSSQAPAGGRSGLDPPCPLSDAYGVSCRARAERAGATPAQRLAAISPEGATGRPLLRVGSPASPRRGRPGRRRGDSAAREGSYLPERFCLQKRRNISSKTRAGAVFLPGARHVHERLAPPVLDSARGSRPRRTRVRRDRREPRHRARDGACAVRRGSRGAAGRALRRARCAEAVERSAAAARRAAAALACDVTDADAGERMLAAARAALGRAGRARQQRRHGALARPRRRARRGLAGGLGAERDGPAARRWRAGPRHARTRLGPRRERLEHAPGKRPSANMPEYSVAKAAQLSLSRLWADRCAADGVLVNAICPDRRSRSCGSARAASPTSRPRSRGWRRRPRRSRRRAPGGRSGGWPRSSEIAAAIVFLCSERASYVAGAAWSVDGGTVQVII